MHQVTAAHILTGKQVAQVVVQQVAQYLLVLVVHQQADKVLQVETQVQQVDFIRAAVVAVLVQWVQMVIAQSQALVLVVLD